MNNNQLEKTAEIQQVRGTPFPRGISGNPNGRPKGRRNFMTDFKSAIRGLVDPNTGEKVDEKYIIKKGVEKLIEGDSKFVPIYLDLLDRAYGRPVTMIEQEINEKRIVINIAPELYKKYAPKADE